MKYNCVIYFSILHLVNFLIVQKLIVETEFITLNIISMGQSIKVVGLELQYPCLSHGQLYVGCSRVGIRQNLSIYAPNGRTRNIVYPEVLR